MNLIKTSALTAVSTIIKIATGLISNKIVALFIGPAGLAVIGQFQNFSSIILSFANGGVNNGIVKYIAEYHDDEPKRVRIISTAIQITLVCSVAFSLFLIALRDHLSTYLFKTSAYSSIFLIFGLSLVMFSLNVVFVNVLNGYKEINKYIKVNIVSSIVSLVFTVGLVISLGIYGALVSYATSQSVILFISAYFVMNSSWFKKDTYLKGWDKESVTKLAKYSAMFLTTALTFPVSHIFIRSYIIDTISLDAAGYWQAIWTISTGYLLVVTTSLSTYYLPRLSEIKEEGELKKEVMNGYKVLLPIVTILALGIFISKGFIIRVLFTEQFEPMRDLFAFQLIGDVIKIASFILGFLTLAKAMTKVFIFSEITFTSTFILLSIICLKTFGLIGITYAYAINYSLYLIFMVYIFRRLIFKVKVYA